MRRPISKVLDYLVLSFIVSAAIIGILIFSGNKNFQIITVVSLSLAYIVWGIFHHLKEGTLHKKIVAEYVAFAVLGTALVIGLF